MQGSSLHADTSKALKNPGRVPVQDPRRLVVPGLPVCILLFHVLFPRYFYYTAILIGTDGLGSELWAYPQCPKSQAFPMQAVEGLLLSWV